MNKKNRELLGGLTGGGIVGRGQDMHLALNELQRQQGIADGELGGNRRQKIKRAFEASGGNAKGMTNRQMLQAMSTSGGPAPIEGPPPPVAPPVAPTPMPQDQVGSQMWGNYGEGPSLLAKYSDLSGTGVIGGGGGNALNPIAGGGGLIQRPTIGGGDPAGQNPAVQSPIAQDPNPAVNTGAPSNTATGGGLGGVLNRKPQAEAPRAAVGPRPAAGGVGLMQKVR